jgi:organic radical activating enzyme
MKWSNKGHEFDTIGHLLQSKKNMLIYGADVLGIELFELIQSLNEYLCWNVAFIDADMNKKQLQNGLGVLVLSPDELAGTSADESFVVACSFFAESRKQMFDTVSHFGYIEMENAFEHDFFLYKYLSIHFIYNLNKVYISSLNIVPSTVCNLNCHGCLNFNPLIKKHLTYTLDSLKADCDALFNSIDLIGRFQITGGEPFLFPELEELIKYIRGNYGKKIVRFETVTNGTVIPPDGLCSCLKNNGVFVFLDDYRQFAPLARKNYEVIREKFDNFQIMYKENLVSEWFDLQPTQEARHLAEDELIDYFQSCDCPWATIWNKSLSSCNYSLYAAKAGIVEYDSDNYFELTDNMTSEHKKCLVEFRLRYNNKGYVELCRQCSGFSTINKNKLIPAQQIKRV